jgi:nucleoside-diphosphate-sugar epimerase
MVIVNTWLCRENGDLGFIFFLFFVIHLKQGRTMKNIQTILDNSTNTKPGSVLVLGANGRLGHAAVMAFAAAGWDVTAQARKPLEIAASSNITPLLCDALDTGSILASLPQVDVIVHALNPDYSRWETLLPPVTQAVITLAKASGALLMVPGNVYNFGKELPAILTEETPFVANTGKAALRIAMEQSLMAATKEGMRCVVIRAGDFIGGTGTWLDLAMTKSLHKQVFTQMGPSDLKHEWAYLPDVAEVFVRVATQAHQLPAYEVLHYEGWSITGNELQSAVEKIIGKPLKTKQMPWTMMKVLSLFSPILRAVIAMNYLWQRPHQLRGKKLQKLIGTYTKSPLALALATYIPKESV